MRPVPTPFAQGTSLAKAKDDDKDLDLATVADIAKVSVHAAAAAGSQKN